MRSLFSKYEDLTERLIVALFGAIAIILAIIGGEWSYFILFLFISILCQREFYKLLRLGDMLPLQFWGIVAGICIYSILFFEQKHQIPVKYYFLLLPIIYIGFLIKLYKKSETRPFTNIGLTFLGIIYVVLPFALLHVSAFYTGEYSFEIVLGIVLIQWSSDVGAYFAGLRFGKRKLFERVSPKKSWEGFAGGTILAILMGYFVAVYFEVLATWQWISIAFIIAVVGTYGDLLESLFKRTMEVKDSGTSLPGHGGFLDRFDSLMLSLPFIAAFLKLF